MTKPLSEFRNPGIQYVFTDIDDTLTQNGRLQESAYSSLWQLQHAGIKVIPVTGRPAGWCELIARQWPVDGVIGENGGFYFRYFNQQMKRHYMQTDTVREENQLKLEKIKQEILQKVPGTQVASDQFCRQIDLAIDFCEDVPPLSNESIQQIVQIFEAHGAQAKVSSIHVNGWFGHHNKLSMCQVFTQKELGWKLEEHQNQMAFIGDSPNDEPMFAYFDHSFAVANIQRFIHQLQSQPLFITKASHGDGFAEFVQTLIKVQ